MKTLYLNKYLITVAMALSSGAAGAQSMMVLGGEQSARDCYMAATLASQMHTAAMEDIQNCNYALDHTPLSLRDRVATYINRGVVYAAMDKYKEAIKDYEKAAKLDPDTGEVYVNRGNLFFLGQVYDQAISEYTKAIELKLSKGHVAHYNRGLAYEKLGEYSKAEEDYRRALEIAPQWHHPQEKLDRVLEKINKS